MNETTSLVERQLFIDASPELEKTGAVNSLIELLPLVNISLRDTGIQYRRSESNASIVESDVAFLIYWRTCGNISLNDVPKVHTSFASKGRPKTWVLFKDVKSGDETDALSDELLRFKEHFEPRYGYFVCRFSDDDDLRFQFVSQLCFSVPAMRRDLFHIENGCIVFQNRRIADLSRLSLFKKDITRNTLLRQQSEIEQQMEGVNSMEERHTLRIRLSATIRELARLDQNILDIAITDQINRTTEESSQRVENALKIYSESGSAASAIELLKNSDPAYLEKPFVEVKKALASRISELRLLAKLQMVNADIPIASRYEAAKASYDEALRIAHEIQYSPEETAYIQTDCANLMAQREMHMMALEYRQGAAESFLEAVQRFSETTLDGNPVENERFLHHVLLLENRERALALLARSCHVVGQQEKALAIFDEVIDAQRMRLQMSSTIAHAEALAETLRGKGRTLHDLNRLDEATRALCESIKIRRNVKTSCEDEENESELAGTLTDYANTVLARNWIQEAETAFREATELSNGLYQKQAEKYEESFAASLNDWANLYNDNERSNDAIPLYEKSLSHWKVLREKDPFQYERRTLVVQGNYAVALLRTEQTQLACDILRDAISHWRELERTPGNGSELARALGHYANVLVKLDREIEAKIIFKEAIDIYTKLCEQLPERYGIHLARTCGNYGLLLQRLKNVEEAREQFMKAFSLYQTLEEKNRGAFSDSCAYTLWNLATMDVDEGRLDAAETRLRLALGYLKTTTPENRKFIAVVWMQMGYVLTTCNRHDEAVAAYRQAKDYFSMLAENDVSFKSEEARAMCKMGVVCLLAGNTAGAIDYISKSLSIYQRLEQSCKGNFHNEIKEIQDFLSFHSLMDERHVKPNNKRNTK